MKEIVFLVEETSTGYSAYVNTNEGTAVTTGGTMDELKANALESYNLLMEETSMPQVTASDLQFFLGSFVEDNDHTSA
jgi:hypothetical protein